MIGWIILAAGLGVLFYGIKAHGVAASASEQAIERAAEGFYKYDNLFKLNGRAFDVPWRWIKAICMNESSLGEDKLVKAGAVSVDGKSWGLMQLVDSTAKEMNDNKPITADELNNPEINIRLGAKYLALMFKMFGNKFEAVISYNQGPGNTKKEKRYSVENGYWDRFQRNLDKILVYQPGNEQDRS
jgi:soluble lytic murein transglycosylase-like protein